MSSTNIFESARFSYRGLFDEDLNTNFEWIYQSEQQIGSEGGNLRPFSEGARERAKAHIKELALCVLAVEKESGDVVALAMIRKGLFPMEYEVGLNVKKEYWGKGYATEITTWVVNHAFSWMTGVHRVSVGAFSSNPAAIAVYKKVGFVQEGVKRKARFAAGKWDDLVDMSILEEEWRDLMAKLSTGTVDKAEA